MTKIAALLDRKGERAHLSPFFGKAAWVVVQDGNGRRVWIRGGTERRAVLCRSLIQLEVSLVVCGWIDGMSCRALMEAGISVVQASCDQPALPLLVQLAVKPKGVYPVFRRLERVP